MRVFYKNLNINRVTSSIRKPALLVMAAAFAFSTITAPVGAVDTFDKNNDVLFSGDEPPASCSAVATFNGTLPAETITMLEDQEVKEKAESNMARYAHAESQTGVPWQAIAAVHYREASMNPNSSIADGSPLTAGESADGLPINSDPNIDAANMANHFLNMAHGVYGLDKGALASWNTQAWAEAFLAYNRGYMFKNVNEPYTNSPYVMNYLDSEHINMKWSRADSYMNDRRLNGLYDNGTKDSKVGALAVAAYLGMSLDGSGSAAVGGAGGSNCSGPGAATGDIAKTAINLSWPDRSHGVSDAKPEYVQAMKDVKLNGSGCSRNGADCGVFVATVMRSSGADPEFPIGTDYILAYLRDNPKYDKIEATDTSKLVEGDVFIVSGHTFLYVGNSATDGGKNMASASCSERTGDRGGNVYFSDNRGTYEIYRKK